MTRTPFRFGIMSTARIGRRHVIPGIARASNAVVTAVASRSLSRARALADQVGADHAFGSYEELLASNEIDGVYIPLPTSQHIEWALKAAEAGKHVLCEKPISLDAKAIAPLIEERDKQGVLVSEAFMVTYHPQLHKARELLSKGALGQLRTIEASFTYYNVDADNMRNRPELGGGVLPDIGVYPVVSARFATGLEPLRVQAIVEFDPEFGIDRFASVRTDFGEFEMMFYVSTQMAARQSMVFHGDKGFLEMNAPWNSNLYEGDELRVHDRGHSGTRLHRFTGIDQYSLQAEAFARAAKEIDSGSKSVRAQKALFSLEDSVRNQRVIDAIYKAGRTGRWERVSPPENRPQVVE